MSVVEQLLQSELKERVLLPASQAYNDSLSSYFANQQHECTPLCFVQPLAENEVALTIKIIRAIQQTEPVKVAIRSGGWNVTPGIANVHDGITIDLSRLNRVSIAADRQTVFVQPGTIWKDLLRQLEGHSLQVCSGRIGSVGVGGVCLGAGVSFHSPRKGFICDQILSYNVVLANGDLVTVTQDSQYADLWRALKGGGNNFAVVTNIQMKCFEREDIWVSS